MRAEASGPAALVREVGVPALFVVLWSTGFFGAKFGLPTPGRSPSCRCASASPRRARCCSPWPRAPWPRRVQVGHSRGRRAPRPGVYLGGVFVGISLGVEAGVSALIVSLQPLLAALAGLFARRAGGAAGSGLVSPSGCSASPSILARSSATVTDDLWSRPWPASRPSSEYRRHPLPEALLPRLGPAHRPRRPFAASGLADGAAGAFL